MSFNPMPLKDHRPNHGIDDDSIRPLLPAMGPAISRQALDQGRVNHPATLLRQRTLNSEGSTSMRSRSLERVKHRDIGAAHGIRLRQAAAPSMVQVKTGRQINKSIPLPLQGRSTEQLDIGSAYDKVSHPIHVHCTADSFNTKKMVSILKRDFPDAEVQAKSECVHCQMKAAETNAPIGTDAFFFEYGVSIFWGMSESRCRHLLEHVARACELSPLAPQEIETDSFSVCYAPVHQSRIANDEITIPLSFCDDSGIKLSISHSLAQSAKLTLYENRMGDLVNATKDMPDHLARTGKVSRSRKEIAQIIGMVFIQKSNVNLLSTVLDTPEYFWSAPDNQQELYKRVSEYLELQERVVVLNNRFEVLTELLNIVREHENNLHIARLEWIVIWLIVVEVCSAIAPLIQQQYPCLPETVRLTLEFISSAS